MNKTKLISKFVLLLTLSFLVFNIAPIVHALKPEHQEVIDAFYGDQRIQEDKEILASKKSYLCHGCGQTIEEKKSRVWIAPYTCKVYMDGNEVELTKFIYVGELGLTIPIFTVWHLWYHIYNPGDLKLGSHEVKVVYTYYAIVAHQRVLIELVRDYEFWVIE